jgi:hypothetical protein
MNKIVGTATNMTLMILGLSSSFGLQSNPTWSSLSTQTTGFDILAPLASGSVINTVGQNFINWSSGSNPVIAGHVTANAVNLNQDRLIDVTEYANSVYRSGGTRLSFVLYRPFRHPAYSGTTSTSVLAIGDELSNGSILHISSNCDSPPQIIQFKS